MSGSPVFTGPGATGEGKMSGSSHLNRTRGDRGGKDERLARLHRGDREGQDERLARLHRTRSDKGGQDERLARLRRTSKSNRNLNTRFDASFSK